MKNVIDIFALQFGLRKMFSGRLFWCIITTMFTEVNRITEIVFASDEGIVFEKTTYKNKKCKVVVKHKHSNSILMTYRFKDAPGLDSPFLSWENLNCCGGWVYDCSYLYTAVQRGKKLFAGITLTYSGEAEEHSVTEKINEIKNELPDDCILGNETPYETKNGNYTFRHYFICKTGALTDYINMDDAFAAYARFGIVINADLANHIKELCDNPLKIFSNLSLPTNYANTPTAFDLIIAGLLLGYPIESTAWLIERDYLLPVT